MASNEKHVGKPRLDKNLIVNILERIGHEGEIGPRHRKNKVTPIIPKEKSYLTKRAVDRKIVNDFENQTFHHLTAFNETRRNGFHTYKSRFNAYKPERLFVGDAGHLPGKAITKNIDPEFYTIVAGRAIKDSEKLGDYRWAVRSCFLTRLKSSKLDRELTLIDKEKTVGNAAFGYAYETLCLQSDNFNKFLEEDYRKSAKLLEEAEAATRESIKQENAMKDLKKELELVESKVLRLDEQWRWYQTLQQFLLSISPLQWAKGDENDCLYFNDPQQLSQVFGELEDKNLGYLVQCENLQPAVITMKKSHTTEMAVYDVEASALSEDVEEVRKIVNNELQKLNGLKTQVNELCRNDVHALVTDKLTINLTACLEDAYERVVGPNDSGLNPLEMMRAIETAHESLRLQLDLLPADLVKRITATWQREQKRRMDEAKVAAKKVHQMEMLVKRFCNAVKLPTPNLRRRLIERSKPPRDVKKVQHSLHELTTEELERKYFFEFDKIENNPDLMYRPM